MERTVVHCIIHQVEEIQLDRSDSETGRSFVFKALEFLSHRLSLVFSSSSSSSSSFSRRMQTIQWRKRSLTRILSAHSISNATTHRCASSIVIVMISSSMVNVLIMIWILVRKAEHEMNISWRTKQTTNSIATDFNLNTKKSSRTNFIKEIECVKLNTYLIIWTKISISIVTVHRNNSSIDSFNHHHLKTKDCLLKFDQYLDCRFHRVWFFSSFRLTLKIFTQQTRGEHEQMMQTSIEMKRWFHLSLKIGSNSYSSWKDDDDFVWTVQCKYNVVDLNYLSVTHVDDLRESLVVSSQ